MPRSRTLSALVLACAAATFGPAHGADGTPARPRASEPAKPPKNPEAEKLRLLAKLQADAPKMVEAPAPNNALESPIFRRYDRP
jgi:hypothetical protein